MSAATRDSVLGAVIAVRAELDALGNSAARAMARRLSRAIALIEAAPPHRRARIAGALRVMHRYCAVLPAWDSRDGPFCEAYPRLPIEIAARVVLGESLAKITGLTAREAHEWASEPMFPRPAAWLFARAGISTTVDCSVSVARWLIEALRDPARNAALHAERVEQGPHGEEIRGRFIDRLDELRDGDLRPSVRNTFEHAARRMAADLEREMRRAKNQTPLASVPSWYRPARCATLLDRPALLAVEGREMQHCVATYVPYVRTGKSVIVAIRVPIFERGVKIGEARSTVEVDRRSVEVRQHKGPENTIPHALCKRALDVLIARWRKNGREVLE